MEDPFITADPSASRYLVRVTDCAGHARTRFFNDVNRAGRYVTRCATLPSVAEVYTGVAWFDPVTRLFHDHRCTIAISSDGRTRTQTWKCHDHAAPVTGYPRWRESRPPHVDADLPVAVAA